MCSKLFNNCKKCKHVKVLLDVKTWNFFPSWQGHFSWLVPPRSQLLLDRFLTGTSFNFNLILLSNFLHLSFLLRLATLCLTPVFYIMAAEKENLKSGLSWLRSCCSSLCSCSSSSCSSSCSCCCSCTTSNSVAPAHSTAFPWSALMIYSNINWRDGDTVKPLPV